MDHKSGGLSTHILSGTEVFASAGLHGPLVEGSDSHELTSIPVFIEKTPEAVPTRGIALIFELLSRFAYADQNYANSAISIGRRHPP
jgi:hypothetical protein